MLENVPCFYCGSSKQKVLRKIASYRLVQCSCGFIFINPRDSAIETITYYQTDKLGNFSYYTSKEHLDEQHFLNRLACVQQFQPKGSVLDIGSGVGTFLRVAKDLGYDVAGVELNSVSRQYSLKKYDVPVYPNMDNINKKYNLVHMGDVLEHLSDPVFSLRQVRTFLLPKGLVAISVPDYDALTTRFFQVKPKEHLTYFTKQTLRMLLEREGFSLLHISNVNRGRSIKALLHSSTFQEQKRSAVPFLKLAVALRFSWIFDFFLSRIREDIFVIAQKK